MRAAVIFDGNMSQASGFSTTKVEILVKTVALKSLAVSQPGLAIGFDIGFQNGNLVRVQPRKKYKQFILSSESSATGLLEPFD